MGADSSNEKTQPSIESTPLSLLTIPTRLAGNPASPPRCSVDVHNANGEKVACGNPNVTRGLVALMNIHAVEGGAACHWGGPAAFAEVNSAIHGLMFRESDRPWHEIYNFINDAGHAENGLYALRANLAFDGMTFEDLRGFRSIDSKLTGHGESHLNPEGVLLGNGPLSSSAGQAQGLAMADRKTGNDRVTLLVISDGASMEGEAKEAFAAIPGLAEKSKVNPFVMVVSDNNTKLSGRITDDAFNMAPTFESLSVLGWNVIKVEKGNDLQTVYTAVESAVQQARENPNKPVAIWLKTVKGYGIKATADSASGGHGFPLKNGEKILDWMQEIFSGDETPDEIQKWAEELHQNWKSAQSAASAASPTTGPSVKKTKIQAGLANGAIRAAKEGLPVYSISSDVQGSTGMKAFQNAFPDQFVEVGVAEANMVSAGVGFSKGGYIPIVDTFGQFGVTKGNLPLTMAALSQAPVIAVFSHVGFQDAADGASHQATTYLAAVSAIPETEVIVCSCANEADSLMYQSIKRQAEARSAGKNGESTIFFVGRENYPIFWKKEADYEWGKAQLLREGSDVVLVASGPVVGFALEAADQLNKEGIQATVINQAFINRVDIDTIGKAVAACSGKIVTVEDHQIVCGMGSQLAHSLGQAGIAYSMKSLGIHGKFGQSAYLASQLYAKHGMDTTGIVKAAKELTC